MIEEIAKRFPMFTIPREDGPYLNRYFVYPPPKKKDDKTEEHPPFRILLHNIVASDEVDSLHDHPWTWAWSMILKGSYIEERLVCQDIGGGLVTTHKRFKPGMVNYIRGNTFHRLTIADEASDVWTLFVHGPRTTKGWGFVDRYGEYTPYLGPSTAERIAKHG